MMVEAGSKNLPYQAGLEGRRLAAILSKTQIDRLGDRLKKDPHTESDLRLLDDYRRSFGEAYEAVVRTLRERLQNPTGRPAKSTVSIVEKLRRESIRLSQMQDIAGCRVVVTNVVEQERSIALLSAAFPGASVIDRRDNPSYGYRAIHIIAELSGMPIEIQVRSSLQHLWAELSEKSSDVLDPTIKYGGGPDEWRSFLTKNSEIVASYEEWEKARSEAVAASEVMMTAYEEFKKAGAELPESDLHDHEVQEALVMLADATREMERAEQEDQEDREEMGRVWSMLTDSLNTAISWLDERRRKGQKQ